MTIGGYKKEIDYERLGPTMMIAASIILAIRTAKRPPGYSESLSNRDWEEEFEFAVKVASALLGIAIHRKPELFKHKDVAWHVPDDSDVLP
jgi:hypothetical protein